MSSRGRRIARPDNIVNYSWTTGGADEQQPTALPAPKTDHGGERAAAQATIERDAFAKGFAQGERAGLEAAGQRGEAMLRRLTETLEELTTVRAQMIHRTEQQMVQLAIAIASRVVQREVTLDRDLLVAMARVALDRLGDTANITVRLNPDDFEITGAARIAQLTGSHVQVAADARISRGGCRVESDLGVLDAGIDAQLSEIARALLGDQADQERETIEVRA
jgi:flagellar assembly protein FliH